MVLKKFKRKANKKSKRKSNKKSKRKANKKSKIKTKRKPNRKIKRTKKQRRFKMRQNVAGSLTRKRKRNNNIYSLTRKRKRNNSISSLTNAMKRLDPDFDELMLQASFEPKSIKKKSIRDGISPSDTPLQKSPSDNTPQRRLPYADFLTL